MTEQQIDAGARALYGQMKIAGQVMAPFDKLAPLSQRRYRAWARVVLEAAEPPAPQGAA